MKNLKIWKKLSVTFGIFIILLTIIASTSVYGLFSNGKNFTDFYYNGYQVTNASMEMRRSIESACKNIGYATMSEYPQKTAEYVGKAKSELADLRNDMDFIYSNFSGDKKLIDDSLAALDAGLSYLEQVLAYAVDGKHSQAIDVFFNDYEPYLLQVENNLIEISTIAAKNADQNFSDSMSMKNMITMVQIILSIAAFVITVVLALYITKGLTHPIMEIEKAATNLSQGNLDVDIDYVSQDELGMLSEHMRKMSVVIKSIIEDEANLLGAMAKGDFTTDTKAEQYYVGDFNRILISMRLINTSLNKTLLMINQSSDQVAGGSEQVSSGAQALSQGATEQASSIEELSATINEISGQTKKSADNAADARAQSEKATAEILESNQKMQEMIAAMNDISDKSNEIGNIIKTIDDIAFQTNILALNAAVEAARAGTAGKGFAVVADEVRNLAGKSAEAAKNTAVLIQEAIQAVEIGTKMADGTAAAMMSVVNGSKAVSGLIDEIASATNDQASAINQVTSGVDQITSVIQNNSATAEESAAASEELSSQAQMLKELAARFRLKDTVETSDYGSAQEADRTYQEQPEFRGSTSNSKY